MGLSKITHDDDKLVQVGLIDCEKTEERITDFIQQNAPPSGVVIGISGGIDSALVLALSVKALGAEKVKAVFMPETEDDISDIIKKYVHRLNVRSETIPIEPIFEAYMLHGGIKNERQVAGNIKARIRMSLLYSRSNAEGLVVMGTGNRSELLAGYFTKYGDGGVDYLPIGDLYKTEVKELASYEGVPKKIIDQAPTAGLWEGQTDEQELGITYAKLDLILHAHSDVGIPYSQIKIEGVTKNDIQHVKARVQHNSFKSIAPPICQLRR